MIRLAGIEMLAEGSSGSLGDFLDKYQPIEDTRAFAGMPAALLSPTLHGKRKGCSTGPGIAPQNYPLRIAPRLNTFYWPSGATRWGHGLFLANETDTTAIVTKANGGASSGSDSSSGSSGNSSVLLEMGDEDQYVMSTKVYVLPPRPVTLGDDSGDNPKLYIIPVVDERYWWQFIDADDISVDIVYRD